MQPQPVLGNIPVAEDAAQDDVHLHGLNNGAAAKMEELVFRLNCTRSLVIHKQIQALLVGYLMEKPGKFILRIDLKKRSFQDISNSPNLVVLHVKSMAGVFEGLQEELIRVDFTMNILFEGIPNSVRRCEG